MSVKIEIGWWRQVETDGVGPIFLIKSPKHWHPLFFEVARVFEVGLGYKAIQKKLR